MEKKCKVIILDNERYVYPALLMSNCNIKAFGHKTEKLYGWFDCAIRTPHSLNHLYIVSDDDIKENDWFIREFDNTISKANSQSDHKHYKCFKIIGTTDPELQKDGVHKISDEFISKYVDEYNKGNIITEVLVEYYNSWNKKAGDTMDKGYYEYVHSIDSNGSIIIVIHNVKETYSREEVISLLKEFRNCLITVREKEIEYTNKWIEDNL